MSLKLRNQVSLLECFLRKARLGRLSADTEAALTDPAPEIKNSLDFVAHSPARAALATVASYTLS